MAANSTPRANPPDLPFLDDAVGAASDAQLAFGFDLRDRAVQLARRDGANVVLRKHVQSAIGDLTSARRFRITSPIGSLGGILLGGGISGLVSAFATNTPPTWSTVVITAVLLVIGAVGVTASLIFTFMER